MKFEIVSKYADAGLNLPVRKTAKSAGYDFEVASDILIPSHHDILSELSAAKITTEFCDDEFLDLEKMSTLTKWAGLRPTLVPTGIKCEMPEGFYLELSVRSSCPLKHWLILANGVGIIDADYYNNPDNEGHIYFQMINLSPFDIVLRKGDVIGQGILKKYYTTDDDVAHGERTGGFGSTSFCDTITAGHSSHAEGPVSICRGEGINVIKEPNHPTPFEKYLAGAAEECVMAGNPNNYPYFVGKRTNIPGIIDEAADHTFTIENYDVKY